MTIHDVAVALAAQCEHVCSKLLPGGKKLGREWVCGDVTGVAGDSMAVALEGPRAGLWHDKASDEGGDLIDLIAANKLLSKGLAAKWGREFLGIEDDRNGNHASPGGFDPLLCVWSKNGVPAYGKAAWPYHDAAGNIVAYVVRFEYPATDETLAKKDIIPIRLIDGRWTWKGWKAPEKKPLFNLHKLTSKPDDPVLIVEGEKTATAAAKLFPAFIVTTCQGGSSSFDKGDWTTINGRKNIVLWPDADKSGRAAMLYLKSRYPDSRLVDTSDLPDGWDLADAVPDGVSIRGLLDGAGEVARKPPAGPKKAPDTSEGRPFRCLGHSEAGLHYLSHRSGRVETITAIHHTELQLQVLAPDDYWLSCGHSESKGTGVNYKAAAKDLFDEQFQIGTYDPSNVRGLGCWIEGPGASAETVYHAGDHLIVNGERVELLKHDSKWIYPQRAAIKIDMSVIATVESIKPVLELCDLLPWHTPGSGWMLAAMTFLAPICGVLLWRPSAWLIGPMGCGKSYIQTNIVTPLIGYCVTATGSTTAAGIRQKLQCDAVPVDFDEIEGKDDASNARIRTVCELMRSSSTETGGSIFKGSPSGESTRYATRSSFILSSIAMGAIESADESRIVRLEFKKRTDGEDEFRRIRLIASETTLDPAFCKSWIARSITYAARIRAAAELFGDAIRKLCGDARKGQQYGAICAGYWYLIQDGLPTSKDAEEFANLHDWNAIGSSSTTESDSARATDILLQAKIELLDPQGKAIRLNVGEVLKYYSDFTDLRRDAAWDALMRIGVHPGRSGTRYIDIALRHVELQKIFAHTQFADRWSDYFRRLEGAESAVFTPPGSKSIRATRVAWEIIVSSEQPELITQ